MKTLYQLMLATCGITMVFAACKSPEIQKVTNYSVNNATSSKVTFDLYTAKEDYLNLTNRKEQHVLEPGETITLPLEALKTYWIDWYGANYALNNWVDTLSPSTDATPRPKLPVSIEDDRLIIKTTYRDTSRSVLMNGNGVSSTWKAVVTSNPQINGTHIFKFRRDLQCEYTYTDAAGGVVSRQLPFMIYNNSRTSTSFRAYVRTDANQQFAILDFNSSGIRYGRDTLMTTFYSSSGSSINGIYPLVRQ